MTPFSSGGWHVDGGGGGGVRVSAARLTQLLAAGIPPERRITRGPDPNILKMLF